MNSDQLNSSFTLFVSADHKGTAGPRESSPAHCFHHAPNIWCKARTPRAGKDNQRTAEPWKQTQRAVSLIKGILDMSCILSLQTLTVLWQAGDICGHSDGEPGEWQLRVGSPWDPFCFSRSLLEIYVKPGEEEAARKAQKSKEGA